MEDLQKLAPALQWARRGPSDRSKPEEGIVPYIVENVSKIYKID
jgi:hypothetical protein